MSYLFRTEHYEMVLKAGDMERCLPALVWHLEDPRVGQSYPNYYVARLASKFVKVVLSGAGGDELFAGYPWRYYRAVVNDDFDALRREVLRLLAAAASRTACVTEFFAPDVWNDGRRTCRTLDIFRERVRRTGAAPRRRPRTTSTTRSTSRRRRSSTGCCVVEDKLSMAHGLETRVPFLDNDLVDFAQRCPCGLKLAQPRARSCASTRTSPAEEPSATSSKTRDGKLLLREVMARYVPEDVTNAIKQGFSAPDASWFRGESIDYVERGAPDGDARIYEYLDRAHGPRARRASTSQGRENRRLLIWSLLNFEHWFGEFLA